jgi:transposase InsO family protein
LNVSWFRNLFEAKRQVKAWQIEYNRERPHSSLGYLTPEQFAGRAASPFRIVDNRSGHRRQGCPDGS